MRNLHFVLRILRQERMQRNMTANFSRNVSTFFVVFLYCLQLFDTRPTQIAIPHSVPWAQPCTPIQTYISVAYQFTAHTENSPEYLITKMQYSDFLAELIENIMITRLGDLQSVEYLRRRNLIGFPRVKKSLIRKLSTVTFLRFSYYQLSKAAVFLEQMYRDEHMLELKERLKDLFLTHLSQMCEIRIELASLGFLKFLLVANRSIMPVEVRRPRNSFERYMRDMISIMKYRILIRSLFLHKIFLIFQQKNEIFHGRKRPKCDEKTNTKRMLVLE